MDPQQYPSVRWFITFSTLAAWMGVVMVAFGAIGAGFAAVSSGTVWTGVGLLAVALFFAACATYNFWLARVTKEGRPVGVQVTLTIQALGAVYYVVQIAVDPAHVTNHVSALIVTGLCAWWYLRALSHLSAPKTPPSAPTVQLQDEWVL